MTISLHSSRTSSTEYLLPREPLLTPPTLHHEPDQVPFKPEKDDVNSLNMRRKRHRRHRHRHGLPPHDVWHAMRKSISLPVLQPRFAQGAVELLTNPQSQGRARRWTVPVKAASTTGLATVVPILGAVRNRRRRSSHRTQSPAMITLRRATTTRNSRKLSLTFFPPPKFSGDGNFFSSMVNSITSNIEATSGMTVSTGERGSHEPSSQTACISSNEVQPSISNTAPIVCTELTFVERGRADWEENQTMPSMRRCSTRYITSDNNVYEIIWEEDGSSTSSEELPMRVVDSRASRGRKQSSAINELQWQLSQSRRSSLQVSASESRSVMTGDESCSPGQIQAMIHSQFSDFARGNSLGRTIPRSKSSRQPQMPNPVSTDIDDATKEMLMNSQRESRTGDGGAFFPPLKAEPSALQLP